MAVVDLHVGIVGAPARVEATGTAADRGVLAEATGHDATAIAMVVVRRAKAVVDRGTTAVHEVRAMKFRRM